MNRQAPASGGRQVVVVNRQAVDRCGVAVQVEGGSRARCATQQCPKPITRSKTALMSASAYAKGGAR